MRAKKSPGSSPLKAAAKKARQMAQTGLCGPPPMEYPLSSALDGGHDTPIDGLAEDGSSRFLSSSCRVCSPSPLACRFDQFEPFPWLLLEERSDVNTCDLGASVNVLSDVDT